MRPSGILRRRTYHSRKSGVVGLVDAVHHRHRRRHEARRDRVDEDIIRAELDRHRFRVGDDAALGGVVGAGVAARRETLDRGDVDDAPARLLHHLRRDQLAAHVDRFEIDRDGAPPVLKRIVQDRPGRRIDGGVVDQHVDPAELGDHVGDDLAIAVVVGDIERVVDALLPPAALISSSTAAAVSAIAFQQNDLRAFGAPSPRRSTGPGPDRRR